MIPFRPPLNSPEPLPPSAPDIKDKFFIFFLLSSQRLFGYRLLNAFRLTTSLCFTLLAWVCPHWSKPNITITERLCQFMDLGRPKQATGTEMPNPSIPVLEIMVLSHSAQLTKLNSEQRSAFSQVTGEIGELKKSMASTTTTLTSLASQVAALTEMVARLLQSPATEPNPTPLLILQRQPLLRSPRGSPRTPGGNRTCNLPSPTPGSLISVGVSWGSASCSSSFNLPGFGLTRPRWP